RQNGQLNYKGEASSYHQRQYPKRPHQPPQRHGHYNIPNQASSSCSLSSSLEALVRKYMWRNYAFLQSQVTSIKNLELQMGQITSDISG
ncbi:hypothetical protein Csa_023796, partial [Cucumis sativus]